jgi:Zn-dependent protease
MEDVYFYAAFIPIVAYSIILHEMAHAVAALWSGDDTAKLANRITLNPIPHIDLIGTILLPGILLVSSKIANPGAPPVVFGWAKPVPVNPYRYRNPVKGDLFVSLAGIITNLILAFIFILLLHLTDFTYYKGQFYGTQMNVGLFLSAAAINLLLAVFNLIPIPPLDGSHVFKYLLPREARAKYEALGFQGMFLIFLFLMIARPLLHTMVSGALRLFMILGGHG